MGVLSEPGSAILPNGDSALRGTSQTKHANAVVPVTRSLCHTFGSIFRKPEESYANR